MKQTHEGYREFVKYVGSYRTEEEAPWYSNILSGHTPMEVNPDTWRRTSNRQLQAELAKLGISVNAEPPQSSLPRNPRGGHPEFEQALRDLHSLLMAVKDSPLELAKAAANWAWNNKAEAALLGASFIPGPHQIPMIVGYTLYDAHDILNNTEHASAASKPQVGTVQPVGVGRNLGVPYSQRGNVSVNIGGVDYRPTASTTD